MAWGLTPEDYPNSQNVGPDATSLRLTGLDNGTTYYFVVLAVDTSANASPPSPYAAATPVDAIAPPAVADLKTTLNKGDRVSAMVAASSGEAWDYWHADHVLDGLPETAWLTPARTAPQEELLVLDFNQGTYVDRVELAPNLAYPQFFPVDFYVDVYDAENGWKTVAASRGSIETDD